MPELPDHQNPGIGAARLVQEGNDRGGARVPHHLELTGGSVGKAHGIPVQIHDLPGVETLSGDQSHRDWECEVKGETAARNHATGILSASAKR
jgi:hypothetical protein